jgi:hypothetical protein
MTCDVIDLPPSGRAAWSGAGAATVAGEGRRRTKEDSMTDQITINHQDVAAGYLAVWNEPDADARAALAERVFTDAVSYVDPLMELDGREALVQAIGTVQQQFPGWRFSPAGAPDGHHRQLRFGWELGPGEQPAPVAGFDVAVVGDDGRIERVHGFLDRVPT